MTAITLTFDDNHPYHPFAQREADLLGTINLLQKQADQAQTNADNENKAFLQEQAARQALQAQMKFYDVLERAFYYMGQNVPYKFGAELSNGGFDCSSFMQQIYADVGIKIHRLAGSQLQDGQAVDMNDESQWKPGDLLIFRFPNATTTASHVGMYLGNGLIIHTADKGVGIIVRRWKDYYANDLIGVRRILT